MVVIVVGTTGGGYSVTNHTAVEQCRRESMLGMGDSRKESGAECWRDIGDGVDRASRHARDERSSMSFAIRASSDLYQSFSTLTNQRK